MMSNPHLPIELFIHILERSNVQTLHSMQLVNRSAYSISTPLLKKIQDELNNRFSIQDPKQFLSLLTENSRNSENYACELFYSYKFSKKLYQKFFRYGYPSFLLKIAIAHPEAINLMLQNKMHCEQIVNLDISYMKRHSEEFVFRRWGELLLFRIMRHSYEPEILKSLSDPIITHIVASHTHEKNISLSYPSNIYIAVIKKNTIKKRLTLQDELKSLPVSLKRKYTFVN